MDCLQGSEEACWEDVAEEQEGRVRYRSVGTIFLW